MAGEKMPPGIASTLERLWPVEVPVGTAFRAGNARTFEDLIAGDRPQRHMAAFIQWLAAQITDAGGIAPWREIWKAKAQELQDARSEVRIANRLGVRYAEVAAVPEVGFHIWLNYVESTGALSQEERTQLEKTVHAQFTANMIRHGNTVANVATSTWESTLDSLRAAVTAGDAYIFAPSEGDPVKYREPDAKDNTDTNTDGNTDVNLSGARSLEQFMDVNLHREFLGSFVSGRGKTGAYFAMLPRTALKLLGREFASEAELIAAFSEIAIVDAGKRTKKVTVGKERVAAICVPWKLWDDRWDEIPPASTGSAIPEATTGS